MREMRSSRCQPRHPLSLACMPCHLRRVIILVKAGSPVDQTIALLMEHMEPGDIIIDGGNEWWVPGGGAHAAPPAQRQRACEPAGSYTRVAACRWRGLRSALSRRPRGARVRACAPQVREH